MPVRNTSGHYKYQPSVNALSPEKAQALTARIQASTANGCPHPQCEKCNEFALVMKPPPRTVYKPGPRPSVREAPEPATA